MPSDTLTAKSMILELDIDVPMSDGTQLAANLFRPVAPGPHPVIVTCTPYGKDVHVNQAFPAVWGVVEDRYPEILERSSGKHMIWECADPEVWVARGYAVLQIDSRGYGKSVGYLNPNSPQEALDGRDAIEWATAQDWCTGAAGVLGLGYITCTNWRIAALQPKGLKAAIFCQGTHDFYRDRIRTDGPFNNGFNHLWWEKHGLPNQNGNHDTPFTDMYSGASANGPVRLSPEQLAQNRTDYPADLLAHPLLDDWFSERIAKLQDIQVPSLVIANWGGLALQLRGTITGWNGLGSSEKWLKIEGGAYFFTFFTPERIDYLQRFFDRYLKGIDTGWEAQPRVEAAIRTVDDGVDSDVHGTDWPLPQTDWRRLHLDLGGAGLTVDPPPPATVDYIPGQGEIILTSAPFDRDMVLAGPLSARLWLSCETTDTDLFLTLRVTAPDGGDVSFFAAVDPAAPPSQGWLRVSQRKLQPERSTEHVPVHAHDERQPLTPGQVEGVEVAIWPSSLLIPAGYRMSLVIGGTDFKWTVGSEKPSPIVPMVHTDPVDRPASIFTGKVTLHSSEDYPCTLSLPVIPG